MASTGGAQLAQAEKLIQEGKAAAACLREVEAKKAMQMLPQTMPPATPTKKTQRENYWEPGESHELMEACLVGEAAAAANAQKDEVMPPAMPVPRPPCAASGSYAASETPAAAALAAAPGSLVTRQFQSYWVGFFARRAHFKVTGRYSLYAVPI